MKLSNQTITTEDYNEILKRLEFINQEQANLQKINEQNTYTAHLKLPNNFNELILFLTRNIHQTEQTIKFETKKFLTTLSLPKNQQQILETQINQLIQNRLAEQKLSKKRNPNLELIPSLTNYPSTEEFLNRIFDLTSQQNSNLYLLKYISDLQTEQTELSQKKFLYEKQQKKLKKKLKKISS